LVENQVQFLQPISDSNMVLKKYFCLAKLYMLVTTNTSLVSDCKA